MLLQFMGWGIVHVGNEIGYVSGYSGIRDSVDSEQVNET